MHRWAGLAIAPFLIVSGLTGAVLPFQAEITHALCGEACVATAPSRGARPLSGIALLKAVETQTGGIVRYMKLRPQGRFTQAVFVDSRPGRPALGYDEVFADPYTGQVRKRVQYGRLSEGPVNFAPFILSLHYSLAAGRWGSLAFGAAALVWFFTSIVGFCLSLPRPAPGSGASGESWPQGSWLRRWAPSWTVRLDAGPTALNFDLHRAAGTWLWPVLLVFAWSAMAFNLPQVHDPAVRLLGGEGLYNTPPALGPVSAPMPLDAALARGRVLMAEQARERGFQVRGDYAIDRRPEANLVGYYAHTTLDGPTDQAGALVWFTADTGKLLAFQPPHGPTRTDAADWWSQRLHEAHVFGLPYRLFVSLLGIVVAGLGVTGIVAWVGRTFGRRRSRRRGT